MKIVISNPMGRRSDGKYLVLFPSRCDWVGDYQPFAYYPYELAYLSSLLKRETKHQVVMADPNIEGLDPVQTFARLSQLEPDILITECGHLTYKDMTAIVARLKGERRMEAWLCGPYGTSFPAQTKADGWDMVFAGEYEAKVLARIEGADLHQDYLDVDWLPLPEDNDIHRINYTESNNPHAGMVQVYASRGCMLSCTFCTVPLYYGGHGHSHHSWRGRDPERVCDEIEYLARRYSPDFSGCFFNEEDHSADVEWLTRLAQAIIKRGLNHYRYEAMMTYHKLTPALIGLLAQAGYSQLRLGCESLDPTVGEKIHKRTFPDKFEAILKAIKDAGIRTYITVMVGAPGSSWDRDMATLDALHGLKAKGLLDVVQHSTATPNPGTVFFRQAETAGWISDQAQEDWHWKSPVVSYPGYTAEMIGLMNRYYYSLRGVTSGRGGA